MALTLVQPRVRAPRFLACKDSEGVHERVSEDGPPDRCHGTGATVRVPPGLARTACVSVVVWCPMALRRGEG
jgi:hypothetical protein